MVQFDFRHLPGGVRPLVDNSLQLKAKQSQLRYALSLLLIYSSLAILLTWPTVTHLTTHLPGDGGDDPAIAWNLWWVKYALLNEGQNPFQTGFLFYPIGLNLAFYTLTVLNALTALPLTLNLGVVTASNLHMFFTFVAGGYGTFLLTRYVLATTNDRRPTTDTHRTGGGSLVWMSAAIAGGFYVFASSKLFYVALGQFNIASNHWIPFAVLYTLRTRHNPGHLKNPLLAGLFLTMQAWAEMTYASFLLVFIGLYWLFWILDSGLRTLRQQVGLIRPPVPGRVFAHLCPVGYSLIRSFAYSLPPHLQAAVLMGLIFLTGISPILAQMLPDMRVEGDFLVEGGGFADVFSADLLGFVIPTMHHPLLGHLITQTNIVAFDKGQHIYIGFILLGLMLVGFRAGYRYPQIRFWGVATVVFALLCLGPLITINGHVTPIEGPFIILQSLPFFKGNRYPSRYSVMLLLSLSVLAGFGLAQIGYWFDKKQKLRNTQYAVRVTWVKPYLILTIISLFFLFEHLSLPLPQSDMRVPPPYQIIAADPDDFTVLDIPFAWRNGFRITGTLTTQFMFGQFYQTVHQKRLLQGNTSRNPEFKFQYFTNAPLLNSLLALETGKTLPPERWQADRAIAAEVLHFFNIKYIVVRPDETGKSIVTPQATIPYIEAVFPVEKIHDEATIKIYRLQDTLKQEGEFRSELLINTDTPLAPLYFGEGWGLLSPQQPIAAQRRAVRLLLPLTGGPQRVTLQMGLPDIYRAPSQSVSLELNGWQSLWQPMGQAWQEYTFEVPAEATRSGLNDLRLHFARVTPLPPLDEHPSFTGEITVLSAGKEIGDFGHILVNGHEVSPNQRGYNVAMIRFEDDGETSLRVANFDTHLDPAASKALLDFFATVPPDTLIAVAAADEASLNLSEAAVLALQSIGAAGDLRDCFRCSHALIGQPGQTAGMALEALDSLRPVGLTTGLGLTEPTVAAMVDWIRVEAIEE